MLIVDVIRSPAVFAKGLAAKNTGIDLIKPKPKLTALSDIFCALSIVSNNPPLVSIVVNFSKGLITYII